MARVSHSARRNSASSATLVLLGENIEASQKKGKIGQHRVELMPTPTQHLPFPYSLRGLDCRPSGIGCNKEFQQLTFL